MSWSVSSLAKHSPVLQVSCITSLTVIAAAFWWLHREQLLNLCLLYQAKRLACWREMGLLKVVDMALFDGGQNPLGSFCCSLFEILGTIFLSFFEPFACFTPFFFIYLYCTFKLYHRHLYFFLTVYMRFFFYIYNAEIIDLQFRSL